VEHLRQVLPVLFASAGAAAVAYGGYGAGVTQVAGASWVQWLQIAALLSIGAFLFVAAVLLVRGVGAPYRSFAAEIATLERLVPTVRRHPDGLTALQDLIEVVFEVHIKGNAAGSPEALVERHRQGGRDHA